MTKEIKKLINVAENLGWVVNSDKNDFTFSKLSPAGQDFNIEITAENAEKLIDEIKERCNSFDCSEETYLWLDNTGHGVNGAPYDMKDIYEDMEDCAQMIRELYNTFRQINW